MCRSALLGKQSKHQNGKYENRKETAFWWIDSEDLTHFKLLLFSRRYFSMLMCVCVFFTYHNFLIFRLQTVIKRFDEYACCDGKNSKYLFSEKRNIKEILFWRETLNRRMHIESCINTILMDKQVKLHTYFQNNKTKNWFLVKSTSKWWLRFVVFFLHRNAFVFLTYLQPKILWIKNIC